MMEISNKTMRKQHRVIMTLLLAVVCAIGTKQILFYHDTKVQNGNYARSLRVVTHSLSNDRIRRLEQISKDSTAPMVHLESVDGHIPWLHIPKTGSSFVNALLQFACANAPIDKPLNVDGPLHFKEYTSMGKYECSQEYTGNPLLVEDHFHENLEKGVYEHNKGKLVGMIREPKSHKVSWANHKFIKQYGNERWKHLISYYGLPEDDKRFSTVLKYIRGIQASFLYGGKHAFRYSNDEKEVQAMVDVAKQRLTEGFQFIGITNRYPESICLFYSKFSKPGDNSGTDKSCKPVVFQAVNTAAGHVSKFNFTNADWEYFEDYDDEVDREIYSHALELFEADLVRYDVTRDTCIARGCWPEKRAADIEETKKKVEKTNTKSSPINDKDGKWENTG